MVRNCFLFTLLSSFFIEVATGSACNADNCYRAFSNHLSSATLFCQKYTIAPAIAIPTFASPCSSVATKLSSVCSCIVGTTTGSSSQMSTSSTASTFSVRSTPSTTSASGASPTTCAAVSTVTVSYTVSITAPISTVTIYPAASTVTEDFTFPASTPTIYPAASTITDDITLPALTSFVTEQVTAAASTVTDDFTLPPVTQTVYQNFTITSYQTTTLTIVVTQTLTSFAPTITDIVTSILEVAATTETDVIGLLQYTITDISVSSTTKTVTIANPFSTACNPPGPQPTFALQVVGSTANGAYVYFENEEVFFTFYSDLAGLFSFDVDCSLIDTATGAYAYLVNGDAGQGELGYGQAVLTRTTDVNCICDALQCAMLDGQLQCQALGNNNDNSDGPSEIDYIWATFQVDPTSSDRPQLYIYDQTINNGMEVLQLQGLFVYYS